MEYLRYLGQLIYNPIMILLLSIVGLVLATFIQGLVQLIFAKPFGMAVTDISIFGFKYSKLKSGKWEYRGKKMGIGLDVTTAFDLDKALSMEPKKLMAKEKSYIIVTSSVMLLAGLGLFAGLLIATFNSETNLLATIYLFLGIWTLIFIIGKFCLAIAVLGKVNSEKSLGGYTQQGLNMLRAGVPFEKMDLKPVSELNYKNIWNSERLMYFILYFEYLDAIDAFDKIPQAVADAEPVLDPDLDTKVALGVCMDLVYYYSYYHIVPDRAKAYYQRIEADISKDTEPNAMFIKGFYQLNCFGNVEGAKECVVKALEKIDTFSVPVEREYTRKCINRLNNAIENYQKQG